MVFVIAAHVRFDKETGKDVFGVAHTIYDYLAGRGANVRFVKHSTTGGRPSEIVFANGVEKIDGRYDANVLVKSLSESRINREVVSRFAGEEVVFIGVDPVNALSGVPLKRKGLISEFVFLTADYADKRFGNPALNFIYHFVDRLCVRRADQVWNVSTRIAAKRREMGLPDSRNVFLPNSPIASSVRVRDYDGNRNFVVVSNLGPALNLRPVLRALKPLAAKYPGVKLLVVGSGDFDTFRGMTAGEGMTEFVTFTGLMPHDAVMELLAGCFIGFALYASVTEWDKYRDSLKAREYQACGLPVVMNDTPSNAEDIVNFDCGYVFRGDVEEMSRFLERCLDDKDYYLKLRANALACAKAYDKDALLRKLLGV